MGLVFDKCCLCIDLRTGCLIIGYLNLLGNIAYVLISILFLAGTSYYAAHEGEIHQEGAAEAPKMGPLVVALSAVLLLICLLFLIFTICLLVGLHKYKRGLVKAYLIYTLIFIVLYVIMFFASLASFEGGKFARDLISILLSIYFLLVIRSYYLKMDDPAHKPAVYNTA